MSPVASNRYCSIVIENEDETALEDSGVEVLGTAVEVIAVTDNNQHRYIIVGQIV